MEKIPMIRIIAAVFCLLAFLGCIIFAVEAMMSVQIGLGVVCLMLAAAAGYFMWHDYQYFKNQIKK